MLIFATFLFYNCLHYKAMLLRIHVFFSCLGIGSFSGPFLLPLLKTLQPKENISIGSWKKNNLRRPHFIAVFGLPVSQREERLREKGKEAMPLSL